MKIFGVFQFKKNHNSVNFGRRQKTYLKYLYEISFSIKKKLKGGYKIDGREGCGCKS